MIKTKQDFISKIHLIISIIVVIPTSFIYGFNPDSKFNIYLNTTDEHNAFKAIMGLYLGFSILWTLGILKVKYLKIALISNIIFMLGLGFGRLLSFLIDGMPSAPFMYGAFGELVIGFYGLWVLKTHYGLTSN